MAIRGIAVTVLTVAVGISLFSLSARNLSVPPLVLRRNGQTVSQTLGSPVSPKSTNLILDGIRLKYAPLNRGEFELSATQDISIFVRATGVQVWSPSGWKDEGEERRGEIWRLKSGTPKEVCVERPKSGPWRAYIRFGTEMKGLSLLKAQVREAWIIRGFANWNGKSWGGGHFGGSYEIFSEEYAE